MTSTASRMLKREANDRMKELSNNSAGVPKHNILLDWCSCDVTNEIPADLSKSNNSLLDYLLKKREA